MKIDKSPYTATLYLWNNLAAFFFSSELSPFHSHNTLQVVFDLRNTFRCRVLNGNWGYYKTVIIRENAIHQLDSVGSVQLLLYIDAGSDVALRIKENYLGERDICSAGVDIVDMVKPGQLERCLIGPNKELLGEIVHQLLQDLAGEPKKVIRDERITEVIRLLSSSQPSEWTIRAFANKVFLSESRLRSLFKKMTGVSIHRYITWNKVMKAMTAILNGATIADAAIDCGFADSPHFTKTVLQMYGVSPSQFIKDNMQRRLHVCHHHPILLETRAHNQDTWEVEKIYTIGNQVY